MRRIVLPRKMRLKSEGDRLQERSCCRRRVVRPADMPDPSALATGSTPLCHLVRELTTEHAGELAFEVLDTLLSLLALLDDERDALRSLRWPAREDARGPREQRLHAAEVVEQARTGEEVVAEGGGGGRGRRGEEEELQRGEGGEVRAAAWRAIDAVDDHHAVHATRVVARKPTPEFARGGFWDADAAARIDAGLTGSQLVDFDVDASSLEDVTIDLVLYLGYFCGGEGSREIDVCGGRPWGERPRKCGGLEAGVDDRRKEVLCGVQAHLGRNDVSVR